MTEYVVFTREQYEAGIEEMAGNMFHGGFMTRRAIGEPVKGVTVIPSPHTHADGKCSRPDLHAARPSSPEPDPLATVDLAALVADLEDHADGNVGDGCWELHAKYAALLVEGSTS